MLLLELIWTRITYQFKIDSGVFEDNLEMEFIKPFIAGKIDKIFDKEGWCYCYLEMGSDELESMPTTIEWQPEFIDDQ